MLFKSEIKYLYLQYAFKDSEIEGILCTCNVRCHEML